MLDPPMTHLYNNIGLSKDSTGSPANESAVGVEGKDLETKEEDANEAYYRKRKIVLKIVVPVLLSVAAILSLSAVIVGLSACLCERNRRYMLYNHVHIDYLSFYMYTKV